MIRINKPTQSPAILSTSGARRRAKHCRDYSLHPTEYQSGQRTFTFDSGIYDHKDVKDALVAAQHSKCCFCEAKVGHDGDVEHYRPKAACCQVPQSLLRPGYYWLAYSWDNLLLCCSACNQRHKRNLFPLSNPNERAQSHTEDTRTERPLFINPAEEDPEQYISFRQEIPYAVRGNRRGKVTIEALGLNREIINERRRDRLKILNVLQDVVDQEQTTPQTPEWNEVIANAKQIIANSTEDGAEFAGMARAWQRGR